MIKSGEHRHKVCKIAGIGNFKARLLLTDDPDIHLLIAGVENMVSAPYTNAVETAKVLLKMKERMDWNVAQLLKCTICPDLFC